MRRYAVLEFLIQPVLVIVSEDGSVARAEPVAPITIPGGGLAAFADGFPAELEKLQAQLAEPAEGSL